MGLPGAGKTTLASYLVPLLDAAWLNADKIRLNEKNWDFSEKGRETQAKKMLNLSNKFLKNKKIVVADFVCPTPKLRKIFNADYVIWMNTIQKSRFEDTNDMFIKPKKYNFKVDTFDAKNWSEKIFSEIKSFEKFKGLF
jgi:adenylylsulfate kinase